MSHDAVGSVIELVRPEGTTDLTWDVRNRLVRLVGPGVTASFTYGPFNRRLSKTVNGETTDYLYDFGNIIQESRNGGVVADYLTGLGLDAIFGRTAGGGTNFLHKDALGSVTLLTDGSGGVVNRYFYEPFGQTTVAGGAENPFQFTGRENDETGLYYYRARYYDPILGRFLSENPIGFSGGDANLYAYVGNNPTNFIDPEGEPLFIPILAGLAAAALVVALLDSFSDFGQICLERPSSVAALEAYQSPGAAARRAKACLGLSGSAELIGVAGTLTPSPATGASAAIGLIEGVAGSLTSE